MKLVCISDTHGDHRQLSLPDGDVLLHTGDITAHGTADDLDDFLDWFGSQSHTHRVFVAGNHDTFLEVSAQETQDRARAAGVVWLNDSGIQIDGVSFWGSPVTLRFHDWSFMRDPGEDIDRHWRLIPGHTDVLLTHGPPLGILDAVERANGLIEHTGCGSLLAVTQQIKPKLHIFGHIHEGRGEVVRDGVRYLNVSSMDMHYRIRHEPVVVDLQPDSQTGT
jgi:Icc-related predicted phosphoesterase